MERDRLLEELLSRISELPMLDIHTHLVGSKLGARGLHDIMLYHMAISDLYAAGCPSGNRLTEYPGWPTTEEAHQRIREAIPFLNQTRNTSISWGVRRILADLYDWHEPITESNWEALDSMIREKADDRAWQRKVMQKAKISRFSTEFARREDGSDGDILHYSLEWGFFTRCQWGEFDTALYEVERCWGKTPSSPAPIASGGRPKTERVIRTLDDVHEAVDYYVQHIPYDQVISMATHISTDLDLRPVTADEMKDALAHRDTAGLRERDIYASYINEVFLTALEQYGERIAFHFSFGAEPLPFETGSRLSQKSISQLAEIVSRHPKIRFQCFLSSQHANQSLCTMCRELPNLSLAGYWWHNFFPPIIRRIMDERLDMLPTNKQIGFFSDAYCVEWAYAKSVIVKQELAKVLAAKVEAGQYDTDTAVGIAGEILFDTARSLVGMVPAL